MTIGVCAACVIWVLIPFTSTHSAVMCAYMARETIAKNTAIHYELKIAKAMKGGNTIYSYIGVSKLSCWGCEVWLRAFRSFLEMPESGK